MVLSRNFVKTGPDFLGKVVLWDIYAIILGGWGRRSSNLGTLSFYWERNARKDSGGRFTVLKSLVVSRYDLSKIHKHVLIIIYYMCSPSIPSHCMSVIMFFFIIPPLTVCVYQAIIPTSSHTSTIFCSFFLLNLSPTNNLPTKHDDLNS